MDDRSKQKELFEPDLDLDGVSVRPIPMSEIGSAAAKLEDLRPATEPEMQQDDYLPPLPSRQPEELSARDGHQETTQTTKPVPFGRRFSAMVLILMSSGFAGLLTGGAAGIVLFTGVLDIDSAWIKEFVDFFRGR